ncbi:MAG: hypothetical protein ABEN55_18720, partial [Bradymonadaceae bacterium]
MTEHVRFGVRSIAILAGLVVGLCSFVPTAAAGDDTLALTLVNGADSEGEAIAEQLRKILRAEDRVKYVSETEVLEEGRPHGVTVETLRKGSERARHAGDFRKTMRATDIHAVLVLDVFSGTVQVVTVGPEGTEISDRRRELSGRDLSTDKAGKLLKEAFGDLIPKWKDWKKRQKQRADASSSGDTSESASSSGSSLVEDNASGETSASSSAGSGASTGTGAGAGSEFGTVPGGVRIWAGGIAGRHSLSAKELGGGYSLNQANPFLGGRVELTATLGRFKDDKVGIGLKLFGSYAPF